MGPAAQPEFLGQEHQHIELAHDAELLRDDPQPATELPGKRPLQAQQRHQFPKAPGGHANAMACLDPALFEARQLAREGIEPLPK